MNGPGELFGTVGFVEHVLSQGLEVSQVRAEERAAETAEVGMLWVVDFGDTPGVYPGTDWLSIDLDFLLRANDSEGKKCLGKGSVHMSGGPTEDN